MSARLGLGRAARFWSPRVKSSGRLGSLLLNVGLGLAALALAVLLWALGTRALAPRMEGPAADGPADIVQVEVLNGAGAPGIAKAARDHLRRAGYDVVATGNYARFDVAETFVLDRVGRPETARAVAAALGLPATRVRTDSGTYFDPDATVVLGRDYAALAAFEDDRDEP